MLTAERRALALVLAACLAPLAAPSLAAPSLAAQSQTPATPAPDAKPDAPAEAEPDIASEADADKRVCRYVKLETASRRKTKVCRTVEEWRELNNPR
jgi:hypothetical protein